MTRPFINAEERIDRIVGRRTQTPDPLSSASDSRAEALRWRDAFGGIRVARGVYRFHTHEEADGWLWRTIARPARRESRASRLWRICAICAGPSTSVRPGMS